LYIIHIKSWITRSLLREAITPTFYLNFLLAIFFYENFYENPTFTKTLTKAFTQNFPLLPTALFLITQRFLKIEE